MSIRRVVLALAATTLVATGVTAAASSAQAATSVPRFDHIVLVMFENHAYSQISGSSSARCSATPTTPTCGRCRPTGRAPPRILVPDAESPAAL